MSGQPSGFIWYELAANDLPAAEAFYTGVVGWTVAPSGQPGMDYRIWSAAGRGMGGLMAAPEGMAPGWYGYVRVDDVDACIARAVAAGGVVCMPATDLPGVGRMGMVADPQGAQIYVMTPQGEAPPPVAPGTPGHGTWHELHAADPAAALGFYGAMLGWVAAGEMDMGPMGTYRMFGSGEGMIGGMMQSAALGRPMWLYYFAVEDIDAAMARVTGAGGAVLHGPQAVPGGGWVIQGRDPQGVAFALVGPRAAEPLPG